MNWAMVSGKGIVTESSGGFVLPNGGVYRRMRRGFPLRSVGKDTRFRICNRTALAYSGLSEAHSYLIDLDIMPTKDAAGKARAAAQKALSIDERLAEAHTSLGLALMEGDWDMAGGEREFFRVWNALAGALLGEFGEGGGGLRGDAEGGPDRSFIAHVPARQWNVPLQETLIR